MSAAHVTNGDFQTEAEFISDGLKGKRSEKGFLARCPAHDDRNASLSITQSGERVLLRCFAGCSYEEVTRALRERNLWSPRNVVQRVPQNNTFYVYNDERGNPLHRTVRTQDKRFWQEHFDGGVWTTGLGPRVVLYHLDELLTRSQEPVCVAEGEKDSDRLRALGHLATTNPMGAGKWSDSYSAILAGREISLFYDNDPPSKKFAGQNHAEQVALSLIRAGCRVRIVDLPEGKDVSDFLELGHTKEDLDKLIADAPYKKTDDVIAWRSKQSTGGGSADASSDGTNGRVDLLVYLSSVPTFIQIKTVDRASRWTVSLRASD